MTQMLRHRTVAATCGAAVAVALMVATALAASGRSYVGRTSQHKPVTLTVSGRMVSAFVIGFQAKCPHGGSRAGAGVYALFPPPPPLVRLNHQGRFAWQDAGGGVTANHKFRYKLTVHVSGRAQPATASGAFRAVFRLYTLRGAFSESCPTGNIRWSVHQHG